HVRHSRSRLEGVIAVLEVRALLRKAPCTRKALSQGQVAYCSRMLMTESTAIPSATLDRRRRNVLGRSQRAARAHQPTSRRFWRARRTRSASSPTIRSSVEHAPPGAHLALGGGGRGQGADRAWHHLRRAGRLPSAGGP